MTYEQIAGGEVSGVTGLGNVQSFLPGGQTLKLCGALGIEGTAGLWDVASAPWWPPCVPFPQGWWNTAQDPPHAGGEDHGIHLEVGPQPCCGVWHVLWSWLPFLQGQGAHLPPEQPAWFEDS